MPALTRREWLRRTSALALSSALPLAAIGQQLDQGPFVIDQDEGWMTVLSTEPATGPVRNPGMGLIGYAWEEGGASLAVREGREKIEQHVQKLASLPFIDTLYIRCDWQHVQQRPGRLNLHPVWRATMQEAAAKKLPLAFRVQLSNPDGPDGPIAMPAFLRDRVPMVSIGKDRSSVERFEPRYDSPAFQSAFNELNDLLVAEFDHRGDMAFVDLMQYGFWGEGHTSDLKNPFPDYGTAERTFVAMTARQLQTWKRTPLAVNTQPDISQVGNDRILSMAMKAGAWLRSDSILIEEPQQIDIIANRPAHLAAVLEDGYDRRYELRMKPRLAKAIAMVRNIKANYWGLWTEADNLSQFFGANPDLLRRLQTDIGYRVRPGWVWQRKRHGAFEVVLGLVNEGPAGVPGTLHLTLRDGDTVVASGAVDEGKPHGAGVHECAFIVPRTLEGRKLSIAAEVEIKPNVLYPMRWAAKDACEFQLLGWNDRTWRKNV